MQLPKDLAIFFRKSSSIKIRQFVRELHMVDVVIVLGAFAELHRIADEKSILTKRNLTQQIDYKVTMLLRENKLFTFYLRIVFACAHLYVIFALLDHAALTPRPFMPTDTVPCNSSGCWKCQLSVLFLF